MIGRLYRKRFMHAGVAGYFWSDSIISRAFAGQSTVVPTAPDRYARLSAAFELSMPHVRTTSPAEFASVICFLVTLPAFG
jgi:hypothetical protein